MTRYYNNNKAPLRPHPPPSQLPLCGDVANQSRLNLLATEYENHVMRIVTTDSRFVPILIHRDNVAEPVVMIRFLILRTCLDDMMSGE